MASSPATATEVLATVAAVRDLCDRLDPGLIAIGDVPAVFDAFAALGRLGGGAVTRMAARYDESQAWKRNGAKSAEDDISRKTGTTRTAARRKLATSKRLASRPKTDDAVRKGELSPEQADAVTSGSEVSPADEDSLLESARTEPLYETRRKAAAAKARADRDREATRRRLHRLRCVRRWTDDEGMANLLLKLPPDEMAEIDAALKRPIDQRFADARHAGRFESVEAYAADVVADLLAGRLSYGASSPARKPAPASSSTSQPGATGSPSGSAPPAEDDEDDADPGLDLVPSGARPPGNQAVRADKKVIALIDIEALNRGHVVGDETCEIAGVGPVAVSSIRSLLHESFVAVVIKDGVDVLHVTHLGRQVTARQRTAIEARGAVCERVGCASNFRLDIDHNEGFCLTHDTRVEDLSQYCWHCHQLKTRHNLLATGPPRARVFVDRDTGQPWHEPSGTATGEPRPPTQATGRSPGAVQDDLFTVAR